MTGKGAAPAMSVIVASYGRSEPLGGMLARLGAQTLAPERFEVVAVEGIGRTSALSRIRETHVMATSGALAQASAARASLPSVGLS
jgi:hypothetical protein